MVTLSLQVDGQMQTFGEKTDSKEDSKKYVWGRGR